MPRKGHKKKKLEWEKYKKGEKIIADCTFRGSEGTWKKKKKKNEGEEAVIADCTPGSLMEQNF